VTVGRRRGRRIALLIGAVLLFVVAAAVPMVHKQWWRFSLVAMKAQGKFSDTSWTEIRQLVRPGSGFWLENLTDHANPYILIANPFASAADIKQGGELFRNSCGACHGIDAHGTGNGPSLAGAVLKHANNDWAAYKVIRYGIAGTSMPAHPLPWKDLWQLVAFVRSQAPAVEEAPAISFDVNVPATAISQPQEHPQDWLTYSGSYDGRRYSRLTGINAANVAQLQVRWLHPIDTEFERVAAVPLVRNGVMYVTAPPAKVFAVDAATGKPFWKFDHPVPEEALPCCGKVNRGVALLGDRVFIGTLDAHLIALSATSGKKLWDSVVADYRQQYTITAAPLAVNDKVITGISGGDFAIHGFVAAYDAATGAQAWRFNTIPGPGEAGHDTWAGDSWRYGGGATWMTGSFDPHSNTVYWGVGNPGPVFNGGSRKGDNLYSDSVVALDADSGKLRWHFQFTPHDVHDWDSTQVPVLIDDPEGSTGLLAWANRNAFFYLLNAQSGKFLRGRAFARQSWSQGLDGNGRPILVQGQEPSVHGTLVYPSAEGATNFWPAAFSADTGLLYVPVLERPSIYFSSDLPPPPQQQNKSFMGYFLGSGQQGVTGELYYTAIRALNARTGELVWERRWPDRVMTPPENPGVMTTAGNLVFGADRSLVFALNAKTGEVLWSFDTGAAIAMPPMTYAVGGRQYVAVISGRVLLTFGLPGAAASH
jgi:alcohol dehydrogenase (cytochrome c)